MNNFIITDVKRLILIKNINKYIMNICTVMKFKLGFCTIISFKLHNIFWYAYFFLNKNFKLL